MAGRKSMLGRKQEDAIAALLTQRNIEEAAKAAGNHAEQDTRNRRLGFAGELAVIESEKASLISAGRQDLADRLVHIAKAEGDGAGYDIRSFTPEGKEKFIEVKTTRGDKNTAFFLSSNEARFASEHADQFYLYRIFEFDEDSRSGKVYIHHGNFDQGFALIPT